MRFMAILLVAAVVCLGAVGDQTGTTTPREPFDRAVKVLRFGDVNEYFEPARADAVACLGLLGDERAVPILAEHLGNEKNDDLRFQITKALGWLKSPKAVSALEAALKDKNEHVREGAALALKAITGKDYSHDGQAGRPAPAPEDLVRELGRLAGAERSSGPPLEKGQTYHFGFARAAGGEVVGKVLDGPSGGWVTIEVRKGDKPATSWVNLAVVATVTAGPDEK